MASNIFTVDVEDWFHGATDQTARKKSRSRVPIGLDAILDLLEDSQTKATFFWLGEAARANPAWVRKVVDKGHEVGCHSNTHDRLHHIGHARFKKDLIEVKNCLEDLAGQRVDLFRAPYFSITAKSLWALEELVIAGFVCDSSIFPVRRRSYGMCAFPSGFRHVETPSGSIVEAPMTSIGFGHWKLPVTGGGYFRLYPYALSRWLINAAVGQGLSVNFYVHPWELDPGHPDVAVPIFEGLRHRLSLREFRPRLEQILRDYSFVSLSNAIASAGHFPTMSWQDLHRLNGLELS